MEVDEKDFLSYEELKFYASITPENTVELALQRMAVEIIKLRHLMSYWPQREWHHEMGE